MLVRKADTVPPSCRVTPCLSVCIRVLNADAHATWCTYERTAESLHSGARMVRLVDSIARTIIAENNDVIITSLNGIHSDSCT